MLEAENRFAVKRNVEEIHARYEEYFEFAQRELEEKLRVYGDIILCLYKQ